MTARAPLGPLLRAFFADHLLQQKGRRVDPPSTAERFSRVPGMSGSLEVEVLCTA